MLPSPERARPEDRTAGIGLAVTSGVGCMLLFFSFFQPGFELLRFAFLAAVGLVAWLVFHQHPEGRRPARGGGNARPHHRPLAPAQVHALRHR